MTIKIAITGLWDRLRACWYILTIGQLTIFDRNWTDEPEDEDKGSPPVMN